MANPDPDPSCLLRTGYNLVAGLRERCEQLGTFGASADTVSRLREELDEVLHARDGGDSAAADETYERMLGVALTALGVMMACLRENGRDLRERFDTNQRVPFAQCHALAIALLILARARQASAGSLQRWVELQRATEEVATRLGTWIGLARAADARIDTALNGPLKGAVRSPIGVSLGEAADLLTSVLPTVSRVQAEVEALLLRESPDMANLVQEGRKSHAYLLGALFDCLGELRTPALSWQTEAFPEKQRTDFLDDGGKDSSDEAKLKRLRRAAEHWRLEEQRLRQPERCVGQKWGGAPALSSGVIPVFFRGDGPPTIRLFNTGDYVDGLRRPP